MSAWNQTFVEFRIFSGRENPVWELEGKAAETLRDRVHELFSAGEPTNPPPDGLPPYLGFRILLPGGKTAQVFRSVVAISTSKGPTKFRRDTVGLEDLLLQLAREKGYGKYLEVYEVRAGIPE